MPELLHGVCRPCNLNVLRNRESRGKLVYEIVVGIVCPRYNGREGRRDKLTGGNGGKGAGERCEVIVNERIQTGS